MSGCLDTDTSEEKGGTTVTYGSYHEFEEDYDTIEGNYYSADPGDTVKITDTIRILVYNSISDFTVVEFASEPGRSETFQGNISDEFGIGDEIMLIFHVIENELGYEVMDETWGRDAPSSSIVHI